jgi:hypothetical protein
VTNNPTLHRTDGVALKDYVDTRFEAVCKDIEKSETALNKRLEGMNEFRDTLKDQAGQFLTRAEFDIAHKVLIDDMRECRDFMAKHQGKASQTALLYTAALAMAGLVIGLIEAFVK